jgi:hypothetical protein
MYPFLRLRRKLHRVLPGKMRAHRDRVNVKIIPVASHRREPVRGHLVAPNWRRCLRIRRVEERPARSTYGPHLRSEGPRNRLWHCSARRSKASTLQLSRGPARRASARTETQRRRRAGPTSALHRN